MLRFIRQRLPHTLRTGLLLAFALSVPMHAVLGVLGELHESTAHAASAGAHLDHHAAHDESTGGSHEDGGGTLHVLMHQVHCCGHSLALAAADFTTPLVETFSVQPIPRYSPPLAAIQLTNPFRPPILV